MAERRWTRSMEHQLVLHRYEELKWSRGEQSSLSAQVNYNGRGDRSGGNGSGEEAGTGESKVGGFKEVSENKEPERKEPIDVIWIDDSESESEPEKVQHVETSAGEEEEEEEQKKEEEILILDVDGARMADRSLPEGETDQQEEEEIPSVAGRTAWDWKAQVVSKEKAEEENGEQENNGGESEAPEEDLRNEQEELDRLWEEMNLALKEEPKPVPKKKIEVGLLRKDAAIDAMLVLGFSRKLITQTIKELLKVYGGDDGWRFIDMDSYKALIDAILEKDEAEVAASSQFDDEKAETSHRLSEVGSSSLPPALVDAPLLSLVGDALDSGSRVEAVQNPPFMIPHSEIAEERKAGGKPDDGTPNSKLQMPPCSNSPKSPCFTEQPAHRVSRVNPCSTVTFPAEEREGPGEPDNTDGDAYKGTPYSKLQMPSCRTTPKTPRFTEQTAPLVSLVNPCSTFTLPAEERKGAGEPDNSNGYADKGTQNSKLQMPPCSNTPKSPCSNEQPAPYVPYVKRRPLHGLVMDNEDDGDDESDLVVLERAPFPKALLKILGRTVPRPRKKSMWDVIPQDKQ